jgi:hypothetical protein
LPLTVIDATRLWLWPDERGEYLGEQVSERWRRSRRSHCQHINSCLGSVRVRALDRSHGLALQRWCLAAGLVPESVNSVTHGVLLGLLRDLETEGVIEPGPYARLGTVPKLREDKRRRWTAYTEAERDEAVDWFLTYTDAGPLVAFQFYIGARIGESAGLRETDFDWDAGTVTIERSRDGKELTPCKEEGSQRTCTMPDVLVPILEPLRGRGAPYFFPGFRCPTLNVASFRTNVWYPGLERAGLRRIHVHDMRHCWATNALKNGLSLAEVAAQLGNTMAVVEKVYAHVKPTANANAAIGKRPPPLVPPPVTQIVAERVGERPASHLRLVKGRAKC